MIRIYIINENKIEIADEEDNYVEVVSDNILTFPLEECVNMLQDKE